MTTNTVCFPRIDSWWAVASQDVVSMLNESAVGGLVVSIIVYTVNRWLGHLVRLVSKPQLLNLINGHLQLDTLGVITLTFWINTP